MDGGNKILLELTVKEIKSILSWAHRCDLEGFLSESDEKIVEKLKKSLSYEEVSEQ